MLIFHSKELYQILGSINHFWRQNDGVDLNDVYVKVMFRFYSTGMVVAIVFFFFQMAMLGGNPSFPSYMPEGIPFYLVYIYEIFVVLTGVIFPLVFSGLFFMTIIMLLQKQFKLLNEQLVKTFDCEPYVLESEKIVKRNIKRCIRHHNFLLRCIADLNSVLSKTLLTHIFFMVSGVCTHMYSLSLVENIDEMIEPALRILMGLFELNLCFSLPAQSMVDQAEQLGLSLYMSKWYKYPGYAKSVLIGLSSDNIETFIDIGGFGRLNMQTCLLTMKTTMSYFMFLRTIESIQ
ncbi:unnamed protein product [Acanthoscelides obtectus]|uniref:Odorant receptor n=1 Tax=Acanthoscelides obtectus TaxID=200917 RepID=A0A9P0L286_ACAOB|nr:unnamed protein product [Acanthoscelides obtectus]CAK1659433.1 hypothetical protein AOBTE_LOCUS21452 [Acanthoscelides obtectus]